MLIIYRKNNFNIQTILSDARADAKDRLRIINCFLSWSYRENHTIATSSRQLQ